MASSARNAKVEHVRPGLYWTYGKLDETDALVNNDIRKGSTSSSSTQTASQKQTHNCQSVFDINGQLYAFSALFAKTGVHNTVVLKLTKVAPTTPTASKIETKKIITIAKKGNNPKVTKTEMEDSKLTVVIGMDKGNLLYAWASVKVSISDDKIKKIKMSKSSTDEWIFSSSPYVFHSLGRHFNSGDNWKFFCEQVASKYPVEFTFSLWMDFGTPESKSDEQHLSQYSSLFIDQINCDVTFTFKRKVTVGAHVAILSAANTVFAAMFQHELQEAKTRTVQIDDIEPVVFKRLLSYMYDGQIGSLDDVDFVGKLLTAADKYCSDEVKDKCELRLQSLIAIENVLDILVLAGRHSCSRLYQAALDFAGKRRQQICFQPNWKEIISKHPSICLELTQRMAGLPQIIVPMQENDGHVVSVGIRRSKRISSPNNI